jgi:type IV pilus assembly protein PilC
MRDVIRTYARGWSGDSSSEALEKHPKAFTRLYVRMVAAGEKGGLLAEILARLATYQENTARLRKKVKMALMYPIVVTVVAIGITIFLLVKVVPVFGEIYSSFERNCGHEVLVSLSEVVQKYFWVMLRWVAARCMAGCPSSRPGRTRVLDKQRIKLPVFGVIAHKICLARFTRAGIVDRSGADPGIANRLADGGMVLEKLSAAP